MRKQFGLGLALFLALAPAPVLAQAARAVAPAPRGQADAVADRYVPAQYPGLVVTYGVGDRAPVTVKAGTIAAEPGAAAADADTLWRIYSMTKPITGIAAMMLIEQGKLKLDQPISDFVPAFKQMKVLVDPAKDLTSRPATRPITVRHLLTHTAGLGYNIITKGPLLDEYNRLGINPAAVSAGMETQARKVRPASLAAFVDRVATLPLIAEPGTKWSYSIGLDVLARVIEVAGGMPFDRFVQTRLFDPLNMRSSYWTVPASEVRRFATNYAALGETRVPIDPAASSAWLQPPSFPYGGAGLVMSAGDYDRFLRMLLNDGVLEGARVLKPETVRLAMSDLLPPGVDKALLETMGRGGVPLGFGAGGSVSLGERPGGPGKGTFGWAGAAGSLGWVDPAHKLRATVMVNLFAETSLRSDVTTAIYADQPR